MRDEKYIAKQIAEEKAAVERLNTAIAMIADDLAWYWHWGDGEGGGVLDKLAKAVREKGYVWPLDPKAPGARRQKAVIPRALSKSVFERDAYRCVICESHVDLTCDHIIAESKGGPTSFENLRTLCRSCNSRKGAREA